MATLDIRTVLAKKPLGMAFDIDGTLSPIAPTPGEARLYPGVVQLLEQAREYAHIAIMTGRAIDDGAGIVNVDGLTYIGNHGLEWSNGLPWSHTVHIVPEALAYVEPGKHLLNLVEKQLPDLPGIIVQHKSVGGSIHYRLAPNPEETREKILSLLEEPARQAGIELSEGKRVVEVRPPVAMNKGLALRQFVQRHHLQAVTFAGDDLTDLDAMNEIPLLRHEGIVALSIVVRSADTLPEMIKRADVVVQGVPGMVELLRNIVKELKKMAKGRKQSCLRDRWGRQ